MAGYRAVRGIAWNPARFRASWAQFENLVIRADGDTVGLLRLLPEGDALGLRDLQVMAERQRRGIGSWAVRQVQDIAARRGFRLLRLRVYRENPARVMYARLRFSVDSVVDGTIHLSCPLTAGSAA